MFNILASCELYLLTLKTKLIICNISQEWPYMFITLIIFPVRPHSEELILDISITFFVENNFKNQQKKLKNGFGSDASSLRFAC